MSYTKPDQTPFAANLTDHETVVLLDTGQAVAVRCECSVEPNTGNLAVAAAARVVNPDGSNWLDNAGQPCESGFSHCSNPAELTSLGGAAALQKLVSMAVLGESTAPLWQDPLHASTLQTASIRTNIASAAHAGPVTGLGALL